MPWLFSDFSCFDMSLLLLTVTLRGVSNKHCLLSFFHLFRVSSSVSVVVVYRFLVVYWLYYCNTLCLADTFLLDMLHLKRLITFNKLRAKSLEANFFQLQWKSVSNDY